MPNPIGQNEAKQSRQFDESGAEITEEMQRRLKCGEAANQALDGQPPVREDTIIGRVAAAPCSPGKS